MKWIAPFVFMAFAAIGLLGTPSTAFSQALPVVWDQTYGGADEDVADVFDDLRGRQNGKRTPSIVALADGGFAVAGYTESKGGGDRDMRVLRLDEAGNIDF